MLDRPVRHALQPFLRSLGARLRALGLRPNHLTLSALVVAIVAAALGARHWTVVPAGLWLLSRLFDGLDGAMARGDDTVTDQDRDLGGFYDIIGDFAAYAAIPVGIAVAQPDARLAMVALLATYYLSGATFLAFSSLAERRGITTDDRSFQFVGKLTEGTETIAVHTAMLLWPMHATPIGFAFAALVAVGVVERVVATRRTFGP